jgi:hypothetical protein
VAFFYGRFGVAVFESTPYAFDRAFPTSLADKFSICGQIDMREMKRAGYIFRVKKVIFIGLEVLHFSG